MASHPLLVPTCLVGSLDHYLRLVHATELFHDLAELGGRLA
jgi:hypothetical protein